MRALQPLRHILAICVLFFGATFSIVADETGWDKQFKELQTYDKLSNLLKTKRGEWIKPERELIAFVTKLSPIFHEAAQLYQVDERVIAGCFVAEHSMNVGIKDPVENFLVMTHAAPKGNIFGYKFTFGPGQMGFNEAKGVEKLSAAIENRAERTDSEISSQMLTAKGSVFYMAAILRNAQDIYKKAGADVSDRPEILASLYNLGKVDERAAAIKESGAKPKQNYFGLFVNKYLPEIKAALSSDTSVTLNSLVVDNGSRFFAVTQKLPLVAAPVQCGSMVPKDNHGDEIEYDEVKYEQEFPTVSTLQTGEVIEVIHQSLGCRLEPWSLVKSPDGSAMGWIRDADLKLFSVRRGAKQVNIAKPKNPVQMQKNILSIRNSKIIPDESGQLTLKLVGSGEVVDWKRPRLGTSDDMGNALQFSSNQPFRPAAGRYLIGKDAAQIILRKKESVKTQLIAKLRQTYNFVSLDDSIVWMQPENIYYDIFDHANVWESLKWIAESREEQWSDGQTSDQDILKFLDKPFPLTLASLDELVSYHREVQALGANRWTYTPSQKVEDLKAREEDMRKVLLENFARCGPIAAAYPKTAKLFEQTHKLLTEAPMDIYPLSGSDFKNGFLAQFESNCKILNPTMTGTNAAGNCYMPWTSTNKVDVSSGTFSVSPKVIEKILKTDSEKDAFLANYLETLMIPALEGAISDKARQSLEQNVNRESTYDPFASAELIKTIASDPLVRAVYVPDPWIIKKLKGTPISTKIIYRVFQQPDRFSVEPSVDAEPKARKILQSTINERNYFFP
jgi:hypothetical protein